MQARDKYLWAGFGVGTLLLLIGLRSSSSDSPSEPVLAPERKSFLEAVHAYLGTWYQWGGGRNPKFDYGVDCSGLVIAALRDAGLAQIPCPMATSNGWWQCLERIEEPQPGDLALYGHASQDRAIHVEVVTSWDGTKATLIGANGGDKDVDSIERAKQRNAFVKEVQTNLRPNFLGFVRVPFETMIQADSMSMSDEGLTPWILQDDESSQP